MGTIVTGRFRTQIPRPEDYWRYDPGDVLIKRFGNLKPDLNRAKSLKALYSVAAYHLAEVYKPDRVAILTLDRKVKAVDKVRTVKQEVVRHVMTAEVEIQVDGLTEEYPVRIVFAAGQSDPQYPVLDSLIRRSLEQHELLYFPDTHAGGEGLRVISGKMNRPCHEF